MNVNMTDHERLELKPDYQDTIRRYEAFWNGDMIDRPIVRIHTQNAIEPYENNYYTRINNDLDELVCGLINNARGTLYLGEALPQPNISFGCDEIAALCGGNLYFENNDRGTSWSKPFVEQWEDVFPIHIKEDNPLWLRKQTFAQKCAEAMSGVMLFSPIDLLTNMDLLQGMRGAEQLCLDMIDRPEVIDKALGYAMEIVDVIYNRLFKPYNLPAANGFDHLQCDFSYMISGSMFRRFVLPYLEREAEYFNNRVLYHWDGPGALTHTDDLLASKNLYLLGYVPGEGRGTHKDYIELYQKAQAHGKAVSIWGAPDEIKYIHKQLRPDRTIYDTAVQTKSEADELLDWFVRNT